MIQHKLNDSIQLNEDTKLGYAIHGTEHGTPIIAFPGMPGSRYFQFCTDQQLEQHNIQLIVIDRPGYGLSTSQPDRNIIDIATDIKALLKHLNINKTHILGYSGGTPYALACALGLPEYIINTSIVAGTDPWTENQIYNNISAGSKSLLEMFWHKPEEARQVLIDAQKDADKLYEAVMAGAADIDKATFKNKNFAAWLKQNLIEAVKPQQGRYELAHEFQLASLPWGFDLSAIKGKVHLWNAGKDVVDLHSTNNGEYLNSLIPDSEVHF